MIITAKYVFARAPLSCRRFLSRVQKSPFFFFMKKEEERQKATGSLADADEISVV